MPKTTLLLAGRLLLPLCFPLLATAQLNSIFTHLTGEEGAAVTLEADIDSLIRLRRTGDYLPAVVYDSLGYAFKAEIRPRGKFRRIKCEVPPIKIKFDKSGLKEAGLDTLNEVKLVFPCRHDSTGRDLVIREYLAYRMFEHLCPSSFRARLVSLEIINPGQSAPRKVTAVLVEHEEELLKRLNGKSIQEWGLKPERMEMDQVALMVAFQYFVGNTDWDLQAFRNVLLVQPTDSTRVQAVPFDFDFSGFVCAPYASPNSQSGLQMVRDRFLMGQDIDTKALQKASKTILAAREILTKMYQHPLLSARAVEENRVFLERFFEVADRRKNLPKVLLLSKE